jgi:hypothetical protein
MFFTQIGDDTTQVLLFWDETMKTSDLLKMLSQQEEKERNRQRICHAFHTATTYEKWKEGKTDDEMLECLWHVVKQSFEESHKLFLHDTEMDNQLIEIKEEFDLEMEGIWSYAMKQKIIIAREAARTARALQAMSGQENVDPNLLDVSVSVAFAKLNSMHHCWRIAKEMDELELPSKSEIKNSMEQEREKLLTLEEETFLSMDVDDLTVKSDTITH